MPVVYTGSTIRYHTVNQLEHKHIQARQASTNPIRARHTHSSRYGFNLLVGLTNFIGTRQTEHPS